VKWNGDPASVTVRRAGGAPQPLEWTMSETGFVVVKMDDRFDGLTIAIR
jgi:hypothetical protein